MNSYLYDYEATSHSFTYSLIIASNDKWVLHFCSLLAQMAIVINHSMFKYGLTPETGIWGVDATLVLDVKLMQDVTNISLLLSFIHIAAKHSRETRPFPVRAMPLQRKGPETKRRRKEATVT